MTLVDQMSTLGNICMYHVDIPQQNGTSITDIALLNPAEQSIILPAATSVVIHVSQFAGSRWRRSAYSSRTLVSNKF